MSNAEAHYQALKNINKVHPNNQDTIMQAQALLNLIIDYISQRNMHNAEIHYKTLKDISKTHSDNQEIVLTQANALMSLIVSYHAQKDIENAEIHYQTLKDIKDQEIIVRQTIILMNLIIYCVEQGGIDNIDNAKIYFEVLENITQIHPEIGEIIR